MAEVDPSSVIKADVFPVAIGRGWYRLAKALIKFNKKLVGAPTMRGPNLLHLAAKHMDVELAQAVTKAYKDQERSLRQQRERVLQEAEAENEYRLLSVQKLNPWDPTPGPIGGRFWHPKSDVDLGFGDPKTRLGIEHELPLHIAASTDNAALIDVLMTPGGLQAWDINGLTPLHRAIRSNALKSMRHILALEPDLVHRAHSAWKPILHFAVLENRPEALNILLSSVVDPGSAGALRDTSGRTPLDLANWKNHAECAKILSDWAASVGSLSRPEQPTAAAGSQES
jgi:ankyrin repeat protein